jgi:hypothetical protein
MKPSVLARGGRREKDWTMDEKKGAVDVSGRAAEVAGVKLC